MKQYYRQTELQDKFGIGPTFCTRICRLIDKNLDIYSEYARMGTQYSIYAFAHARKYYREIENEQDFPAYNPEEIKKAIDEEQRSDCEEARQAAERELRLTLIERINDWFTVTKIPKDMKATDFAPMAKKGMLSLLIE